MCMLSPSLSRVIWAETLTADQWRKVKKKSKNSGCILVLPLARCIIKVAQDTRARCLSIHISIGRHWGPPKSNLHTQRRDYLQHTSFLLTKFEDSGKLVEVMADKNSSSGLNVPPFTLYLRYFGTAEGPTSLQPAIPRYPPEARQSSESATGRLGHSPDNLRILQYRIDWAVYWRHNIEQPLQFSRALASLAEKQGGRKRRAANSTWSK